MTRSRIVMAGLLALGVLMSGLARSAVHAQSAARPDTGEAALSALVTEIRALRADIAAASRNQLRAQMLLGRVQMQEQRIAYLDKQRAETAAQVAQLAQMTSVMRNQFQFAGVGRDNGCARMPSADERRECEAQAAMIQRQLADQQAREQQLRAQENDLASAVAAEQARWSDFNARLDELERTLR